MHFTVCSSCLFKKKTIAEVQREIKVDYSCVVDAKLLRSGQILAEFSIWELEQYHEGDQGRGVK